MINHISICFYHNINVKEKFFFFRARVEKGIARHIDASSVDSYQQGQITGSQIVVKYNIPTFRYFNNHLSNYTKTIIRLRLVNIGEYSPRLRLGEYLTTIHRSGGG